MTSVRDEFPRAVVDVLCKRAGYICSNPDCRAQTLAPSGTEQGKYLYIGKAAHICAAAPGGPRYRRNMSSEERRDISNAIFLCSSCADLIDKNNGADFPEDTLRHWKTGHEHWISKNLNKRGVGRGGDGGSGVILGDRGTIIGGRGGDGGTTGVGGRGGSGFIDGDDGLIIGGDGGSAATADGRGGRAARGPTEQFGFPTDIWGFGRGGSGANHPEYDRRIALLKSIRTEYTSKFPQDSPFVEAGIDTVPLDWVNQRLNELGESWQVEFGKVGYVLPPIERDK